MYIAFGGLVDVPRVLGARATYTIGGIGGVEGRALRAGDLIPLKGVNLDCSARRIKQAALPTYEHEWTLHAIRGPQADPEFMTAADMDTFFSRAWKVSPQSSRTGIRLEPHRFQWARESGGVAGGHPSNILDDGYPVGGVDMNGDTPVILGPDGPTAGGFVVLATVIRASLWKLGQLRPGRDTVRFQEVGLEEALQLRAQVCAWPGEVSLEVLDN
jgi:urea carboxylase